MSRKIEDYFEPIVVREFDEAAVEKFRKEVLAESVADPEAPIIIHIDSYGGVVDALAAMIEILESVPNPIHTVAAGKAMSCGAFLLSYGDERYCGEHSTIMVHEVSGGAAGNVDDIENEAREIRRINELWFGRMADWIGLKSVKELKARLKKVQARDVYLDAKKAKAFGIVDHIGVPPMKLKKKHGRRPTRKKGSRRKAVK